MVFCSQCAQDPPSRSALHPSSSPIRHHPLITLSSFLIILTGVQGRREGPTFDTISFSGLTPCNPVTFSWTGGLSPFSLVIYNDNTGNTVQEFDGIESNSFSWTPPQRAVGRLLYAVVYDDDEFYDDTDDFVVQSASCSTTSSVAPPTIPTTPVTSTTTRASAPLRNTPPPTDSPTSQFPLPTSSSTSTNPSSSRGSSSPLSQSLSRTSTSSQPSNSNTSTSTTTTTGTSSESATDGSTSGPTSSSSTTPAGQSTSSSRPHRKSSVPAGEIAGIVLGAVAILVMLVALVTWWWLVRRRTRDRARTPEDDNYTALHSSSKSTQHEPSLSSGKAAIRRHAYSTVSPTTTAPLSLLHTHTEGSELEGGGDGDGDGLGGDVLHVRARPAVNSLAVEPPTPQPFDSFGGFDQPPVQPEVLRPLSVLPPPQPFRSNGAEMKAPSGRVWGGRTTAVVADSPAAVAGPAGIEARRPLVEGMGLRSQDHSRVGMELRRDVDPDAKLPEDGAGDGDVGRQGAVLGARARLTVIESDGGVRLAGGPPGLTPLDTDCTLITTLPPPYRHYDSSSVS